MDPQRQTYLGRGDAHGGAGHHRPARTRRLARRKPAQFRPAVAALHVRADDSVPAPVCRTGTGTGTGAGGQVVRALLALAALPRAAGRTRGHGPRGARVREEDGRAAQALVPHLEDGARRAQPVRQHAGLREERRAAFLATVVGLGLAGLGDPQARRAEGCGCTCHLLVPLVVILLVVVLLVFVPVVLMSRRLAVGSDVLPASPVRFPVSRGLLSHVFFAIDVPGCGGTRPHRRRGRRRVVGQKLHPKHPRRVVLERRRQRHGVGPEGFCHGRHHGRQVAGLVPQRAQVRVGQVLRRAPRAVAAHQQLHRGGGAAGGRGGGGGETRRVARGACVCLTCVWGMRRTAALALACSTSSACTQCGESGRQRVS
jgi:hypothetical protein